MRAKKVDTNQSEIVGKLRRIGASVFATHAIGKGFPDIVVGYRGINYLFEIKDGKRSASRKKLTPDEVDFHRTWAGKVHVIESFDNALKIIL